MEVMRLGQRKLLSQFLLNARNTAQQNVARRIQTTAQPTFRTRPFSSRSLHGLSRTTRSHQDIWRNARGQRRWNSSSAEASSKPDQQLSLGQRLKKMSREYGWTAVGVYFALSALDFPFCFLAVRTIGTDTIGHWEHVVVSKIKEWVPWTTASEPVDEPAPVGATSGEKRLLEEEQEYAVTDHGYAEAEKANSGSNASLWTQLALAYAIHKSFIFIRVPLTAAILPKVVKTLRGWGYNIGKMPAKKVKGVTSGVNTKGTGVKPDGK